VGGLLDSAEQAVPRVVDDHVDPAESLHRSLHGELGSFLVADVKFDGEDLIGKAAHEVGERPGVPGGGSYAVATPEGGQGEFVADTGGGSGDEPGPACRCVPVSHATLLSE